MEIEIPLEKMSTAEKLRALESIWVDLQRTPENLLSRSWHKDIRIISDL